MKHTRRTLVPVAAAILAAATCVSSQAAAVSGASVNDWTTDYGIADVYQRTIDYIAGHFR